MTVLGYGVGEITAAAAMTSDLELPFDLPFHKLNDYVELERRTMDVHPGMNRKYTPIKYDPVTGTPFCGGRYLFDTWENVGKYFDWTLNELEFESGVKFWNRGMFRNVDKHIWKVIGAHDFTSVETHGVNRFERWHYTADSADAARMLVALWPQLREKARQEGLGSIWLLDQPQEKQVAIMISGSSAREDNDVPAVQRALDALADMASFGLLLPDGLGLTHVFNRTTVIFSTWLPLSRQKKGAPAINPTSPPLPFPGVEPQVA